MKTRPLFTLLLSLLLAPALTRAADTDTAIAPYVDQQTVLVARIDTAAVDVPAIRKWMEDGLKASGNGAQDLSGPVTSFTNAAEKWLGDFRKAGGGTLYIIVNFAEQPDDAIFLAAPLKAGTDSKAVEAALASIKPQGMQSAVINQTVFVAGARMLERLPQFKPTPRPDLAQALADAGNAPITAAIVPSDEIRKVFEAMSPKLPEELGGGPITIVTGGLRRATLTLEMPPTAAMSLKIQSLDAASAQSFATLLRNLIQMARQEAVKGGLGPQFNMLTAKLDPQVAGDQISFNLKSDNSSQAAGLFADSILKARQRAQTMQIASNMKQLLLGCIMYSTDHKGELPATLEAALKTTEGPETLLSNPRDPKRNPAFVYHKPDAPLNKIPSVSRWVLIYEAYDQWPKNLCVGFADGHVEVVSNENDFKKMLDESVMPK
jgi:hypothetical protein